MAKDDNTHTRGAVKDPEHDGRLKENRGGSGASGSQTSHTQGAVRDPEHDGRLKENRDKGVHKSDD
jgi:hypothetical protein